MFETEIHFNRFYYTIKIIFEIAHNVCNVSVTLQTKNLLTRYKLKIRLGKQRRIHQNWFSYFINL